MSLLFCVRPATRNIGNDVINRATAELIAEVFGADAGIVNIPALKGAQFGGFTVPQVYDMNRFADGVVLGGGNLFENGQVTVEPLALAALKVPMLLIGLSHGQIYGRDGALEERTDAMSPALIRQLIEKARCTMVRDAATHSRLQALTEVPVTLAGCPTMFMAANPPGATHDSSILLSLRNLARMSVPAPLQWRIAEDVRRLIAALQAEYGDKISLVCHDYADIAFASAFPEAPLIYFDDVSAYIFALRRCRLNVSYRLHAFLPCLSFGAPTIHLSYDERGRDMLATAGMGDWDIDLMRDGDVVDEVMTRARAPERFRALRNAAQPRISAMRETTMAALRAFARDVSTYKAHCNG